MENKNITTNLLIKQLLQSDNMAYVPGYISSKVDIEFGVLNKAYQDTGKEYAKLKTSMEQGKCGDCIEENNRLTQIENSPKLSLAFLENIMGELAVTQTPNYDPNNYLGLSETRVGKNNDKEVAVDGYDIELNLLDNGTQEITFSGPVFDKPLVINSAALQSLLDSGTSMVVATPDINVSMTELLVESQLFTPDNVGENGQLSSAAKISDEFVLKFNGEPDYEILDIGNGKGRNILRFDMDKIERKIQPFINAEVAGLLSTEQEAIAAWNVYLSKGTSSEEDDQMVQNANAGEDSWTYEKDLPLYQDKKIKFADKYKKYFYKNYLKQFLENKLPSVEKDAAVFDLEEARKAKAQKLMGNQ